MSPRQAILCGAARLLAPAALAVAAQAQPALWTDAAGDSALRLMDGSGPVVSTSAAPDLLSVSLQGWHPQPGSRYEGRQVGVGGSAPTLRVDVQFAGVVNPPGELGLFGTYTAFEFGPTPVFGFIEFDVDRDLDTGGELPGSAELRYLANVGRFGAVPAGVRADRTARSFQDLDNQHHSPPHYERSGADFALVLCGCHPVEVLSSTGNDMVFSAGETWVVRSRFFQRAGGYSPASVVWGGSEIGTYDPPVELRFRHDVETDITTVTLVYPLDETGAALLAGEPSQAIDQLINYGSHWSVVEALHDLVLAADRANFGHPLTAEMLAGWQGRNARDYLDPTQWDVRAIVGTAYDLPSDALYVWSDVAFGEIPGDVNGDGSADEADNALINQFIAAEDGGPMDADGVVDGRVQLFDFGYNFSVYDVNYDGAVDSLDLNPGRAAACTADWDGNDIVEVVDLLGYLTAWFAQQGDVNDDGVNDTFDLLTYLDAYFLGC